MGLNYSTVELPVSQSPYIKVKAFVWKNGILEIRFTCADSNKSGDVEPLSFPEPLLQ